MTKERSRLLVCSFFFSLFSFYARADLLWAFPERSDKETSNSKNLILDVKISSIIGKSKDNKNFESLEIDGLPKSRDLFKNSMPYKTFLVSGKNLKLKITPGKAILLSGINSNNLALYKGEKCRCNNLIDQKTDSLKEKNLATRPVVLKTYLGDFRGKEIYKIELSPAQIKSGKIYAYPDLKVEVRGKSKAKIFVLDDANLNKNMLILHPPHFLKELGPFIEFKRNLGFEIFTQEVAQGTSFNEIKNEVFKIAKENKISYLLIIGSEKLITTEYLPTNFEKNTPSDLALSLLGGVGDLIPDIMLGRISVNFPSELESWVQKTISYEKNPGSKKFKSIALASNEGANPSDVDYVKEMTAPLKEKFNFSTQYIFQGEANSNVQTISDAINGGVDFINYIGHGSGFSWPSLSNGQYNSSHLKNLNNEERYPIVIDVACQNGRFQGENRFGESFVTGIHDRPSGAVAYYGGTVDISWDPPAIMAMGISSELNRLKENILGISLLKGQLYLMKNYSDENQVRYNFIWYHLQGDPSLMMKF